MAAVQIRTKDISERKDFMYNPWLYVSHRSTTQFAANAIEKWHTRGTALPALHCMSGTGWKIAYSHLHYT